MQIESDNKAMIYLTDRNDILKIKGKWIAVMFLLFAKMVFKTGLDGKVNKTVETCLRDAANVETTRYVILIIARY